MNSVADKLWNRNFSLLIIVQILAMFGNAILSFTLPLYILDISNSPTLFGIVLALSSAPLVVMSPIGGIISDRNKKQRIIFWMDIITFFIIVLYVAVIGVVGTVIPIAIAKLMAINVLHGIYMPTVMASVPFLVPTDKLVPANAVSNVVTSLSNAIGPIVGSVLYASFGLTPVLIASIVLYFVIAIIDLFIEIPHKKQKEAVSFAKMIKDDLTQSFQFGLKEKPVLSKLSLLAFLFSVPSVAMILVGLPVLITQTLEMDIALLGLSQGITMIGGLLGAVLASVLEKKMTVQKAHWMLLISALFNLPIALAFLINLQTVTIYIIITLASVIKILTMQMVIIQILSFIQAETPEHLMGKIISVIMAIYMLAYPVGQLLFGMLFEAFAHSPWVVILISVLISAAVAVYSQKLFSEIPSFKVILSATSSAFEEVKRMKNEILTTNDLWKSFSNNGEDHLILTNLDVKIYEGDFTVIMGPSGAGKSTLLYALSGMDSPSFGTVNFAGQNISDLSNDKLAVFRRDNCGFVFQQTYLLDNMSILDNVLVAGLLINKDRKNILFRAKQLLQYLNLDEKTWHKFSSQVSGGEAQRAGIARALINQPKVVFADEPTGALNSANGKAVLDALTAINRQGQSIVMVTHDLNSAKRGDRILYLRDGAVRGECVLNKYVAGDESHHQKLNAFLSQMGW